MKSFGVSIVSVCMGLFLGGTLQAQVDTATIVGTVQDSSGAVVPAASITATAVGTNIKTSARTDSTGNYVITPLKIGEYSVAVEAQGFKAETRGRVLLQVQDRVRVDFTLQVGAVTEAVNIEAEVPVVQTESSALGDVIGSLQISDLPLNGRDYTQLATLTTGVAKITENGGGINGATSATNGNAGGAFAVNGTRGNLNNFMLDGVDNNSNDNAGNILRTSVDAIEEFKVQTSNYSAEFGRSGGAVINATIKSGTNAFHGTVFEFLRNSALDARGFFESPDQPKAPFKQNQFGGTLGGPIKKDKAFFFVDYEGTRIHSATTDFATIPTAAERTGNFSDILGTQSMTCGPDGTSPCVDALGRPVFTNEIYNPATTRTVNGSTVRDGFGFDPVTGLPIPGQANNIPMAAMNSVGLKYAALYPAINVPGAFANNYVVNAPGNDRIDQMDARADQNITSKTQLFERFSLIKDTRFQAPVFSGIADGGGYNTGNRPLTTQGLVLGLTDSISPNVVNALRVGFNRVHYISNSPSYGQHYPPPDLLVPGTPNNPLINGLTWFAPGQYAGLGEPTFTPTRSTSQ